MVVGDDVVGDDFLVAVLIFSALAPLLRGRGPENGVATDCLFWSRTLALLLSLSIL